MSGQSFDRRTYQREYARMRRKERWAVEAMKVTHCPRMLARGVKCGFPLASRLIDGRTRPYCEQCERKAAGVCLDCRKAPVCGAVGKALRCAVCKKLERHAAEDRWRAKHPAKVRQWWKKRKARERKDPEYRARVLARKKAWRLANPTRKRKYAAQYNRSASARRYQVAYRAKMRAERAEQEKERYRRLRAGDRPTHPCRTCGTPLTGRPKKCPGCRARDFQNARALLFQASSP